MFGFGIMELVSIGILILILFRPKELPTLAREILRVMHIMKRVYHQLEKEWHLSDPYKPFSNKKINNENTQKNQ